MSAIHNGGTGHCFILQIPLSFSILNSERKKYLSGSILNPKWKLNFSSDVIVESVEHVFFHSSFISWDWKLYFFVKVFFMFHHSVYKSRRITRKKFYLIQMTMYVVKVYVFRSEDFMLHGFHFILFAQISIQSSYVCQTIVVSKFTSYSLVSFFLY